MPEVLGLTWPDSVQEYPSYDGTQMKLPTPLAGQACVSAAKEAAALHEGLGMQMPWNYHGPCYNFVLYTQFFT